MGVGDVIQTERGPAKVVAMEWGNPVVETWGQIAQPGFSGETDPTLQDPLFDAQVGVGGLKKTIEEV
jgi:hypothetical protein